MPSVEPFVVWFAVVYFLLMKYVLDGTFVKKNIWPRSRNEQPSMQIKNNKKMVMKYNMIEMQSNYLKKIINEIQQVRR